MHIYVNNFALLYTSMYAVADQENNPSNDDT